MSVSTKLPQLLENRHLICPCGLCCYHHQYGNIVTYWKIQVIQEEVGNLNETETNSCLIKKKKKSQSKENDETFLRYPINYNKSDIKT